MTVRKPGFQASSLVPVASLSLSLLTAGVAVPAHAHLSLERAGSLLSRDGDKNLKYGPCGKEGSTRAGNKNIYTFEPGQTIEISVVEWVPHPGYFRIAFDIDGQDGFIPPASIDPVDPERECPRGDGDFCGESDFYNSPEVLPGMDNLDPHNPSVIGGILNPPTYTWSVTLPNVECDNCTLQIIQVMEDVIHGDYNPAPGVGIADIYYQCVDMVLKKGATGEDNPVNNMGDDAGVGGGDGDGDGDGDGSGGGSSVDGGSAGSESDDGSSGNRSGGGDERVDGGADSGSSGEALCSVSHGARSSSITSGLSLFVLGFSLSRMRRRRR